MGSRKRGNLGGSGAANTRQDWQLHKRQPKELEFNVPFQTIEEVNEYLDDDLIYCLECGGRYKSLASHIHHSHTLSPDDYRRKYNIPMSYGLCSRSLKAQVSNRAKNLWSDGKMEHVRKRVKSKAHKKKLHKAKDNAAKKYGPTGTVFPKLLEKTYTATCRGCNKEFEYKQKTKGGRKFCSVECMTTSEEFLERQRQSRKRTEVNCDHCGKLFEKHTCHVSRNAANYCSRKCDALGRRKRLEKDCVVCGKTMSLTPSNYVRLTTCSKECSSIRRSTMLKKVKWIPVKDKKVHIKVNKRKDYTNYSAQTLDENHKTVYLGTWPTREEAEREGLIKLRKYFKDKGIT